MNADSVHSTQPNLTVGHDASSIGTEHSGLPFDPEYVHGYVSELLKETVGNTRDPHIRALMEWLLRQPAGGWASMADRHPERGQLIVKRWRRNGAVWAGIYAATDKDSSFDEWVALPVAGSGA